MERESKSQQAMFYSHGLLSQKGPLGIIWLAAHCPMKLKKDKIHLTNISSSVDTILREEVSVVPRISSFLLLGFVRIYSMKVEYFLDDCRHFLSELQHFSTRKNANARIKALCATYSSISVPERLTLDSFELEVPENSSRDHLMAPEDITLEEKTEEVGLHSFHQFHLELDASQFEDVSPPNIEASMEKFCARYSLEECLPPLLFDEADEERQTNGNEIESPHCEAMHEDDDEPEDFLTSFNKQRHAGSELTKLSQTTSLENEKIEIDSQKRPVAFSIEVTPEVKVPDAAGGLESMAVITPATREGASVSKKPKYLLDGMTRIRSNIYKKGLDDSSCLVRKLRTRHAAVISSKENRNSNLPKRFSRPLISSFALTNISGKKQEIPKTPVRNFENPATIDELESPVIDDERPEEEMTAPSTPLTQSKSTSIRFNSENRGGTNSERASPVGPATSFESIENDPFPSEDQEFNGSFMSEELNLCEGDTRDKDNWSVKTSAIARFLHKYFVTKKKRSEDQTVNLSEVLVGKTKKGSARVFYEILALKTGGYVNVEQENGYHDISVTATTKLKEACEADK